MNDVYTWHHSRKGPITGTVVWESDEWIDIRLVGNQELRWLSQGNRIEPPAAFDGDILRVRKSFLSNQSKAVS